MKAKEKIQTNFHQTVPQTRAQKIAMYMKMPKREVVKMLVNCGDLLSGFNAVVCYAETELKQSQPRKAVKK